MRNLNLYDLLNKRVLVTRDSARAIEQDLADALDEGKGTVVLDFTGVEGLTPSFLDETLSIIEECAAASRLSQLQVSILEPPTQLSSKFAAVGRGHHLNVQESNEGSWIISKVE